MAHANKVAIIMDGIGVGQKKIICLPPLDTEKESKP